MNFNTMEKQITPTPIVETVPAQNTAPVRTSYHRKTRIGWIIVIVLGVILVGGIIWYVVKHHKKTPSTPVEMLQSLEDASQPVEVPVSQRANELKDISRKSAPVKATPDDRIKMLDALK
ncbi:MAG: hypothetical protein JWL92_247 [Candidatus Nomurabacteria bacterium]|nr:hypothetical protein [Candidatus Nomurabacteria bacterium]